jgi:HPr kinase/phosphorylase
MRTANIHASCVVLGRAGREFSAPEDAGVLLLGESGCGKSDLALRLIDRGAVLVADDRVELFARDGRLWGRAPANLKGLLEIRGVGIVSLAYRPETAIGLAILLVVPDAVPRLPEAGTYIPPQELELSQPFWPPLVKLAAAESSCPAKIVAAAAAFAHALFRDDCNPT